MTRRKIIMEGRDVLKSWTKIVVKTESLDEFEVKIKLFWMIYTKI
jgi:hypothetical protein